jgi:hypothetical protein
MKRPSARVLRGVAKRNAMVVGLFIRRSCDVGSREVTTTNDQETPLSWGS